MSHTRKILYLGNKSGNSLCRSDALHRLGHEVEALDPWEFLPKGPAARKILSKLIYEIGATWLESYIRYRLDRSLRERLFDIVWNNQCELIGDKSAALLRRHCNSMVAYSNDDPFGGRDKKRFALYRDSVRHYDLVAVVREPNVVEAYALGSHKVIRVFLPADEVAHAPIAISQDDFRKWRSEVAFVGTWMPERGPFLARLLDLGVPVTLRGDRWRKAREWPILRKAWRGPGVVGKDYVKAIQSAKICLGLLSKSNRDLHTHRSAEIPYIGSVLCAERTIEHQTMYQEDEEAVFWDTPEECAQKCFALLSDEAKRHAIASAGRQRCIQSRYLNEPIIKRIIDALPAQKGAYSERWQQ
jgi:spore maturation protein CgeB